MVYPLQYETMLTRLEVDGFKNLHDFKADFGPYTCVVGKNAIGKSNMFDAIAFLSHLTKETFSQAAVHLRAEQGDIQELFGRKDQAKRFMSFAAEMIVPPTAKDEFDQDVPIESTYLRYELKFQLVQKTISDGKKIPHVQLVEEQLLPLQKSIATKNLKWASAKFIDSAIKSTGHKNPFMQTISEDNAPTYVQPRSSNSGQNPRIPVENLNETVLSTMGTRHEYPPLLGARAEMASWLQLELEPSAMRAPNSYYSDAHLSPQGGNLAITLQRLIDENGDHVRNELVDIVRDLVNVRGVNVDYDEGRQLFTLNAQLGTSPSLPARVLSDGTLRFLALGLLYLDFHHHRLVCFEEPENGIAPDKLEQMFNLLHDLTVDPHNAVNTENPLRQVIVNSHSPAYLFLHKDDLSEVLIGQQNIGSGSLQLLALYSSDNWRMEVPNIPATDSTFVQELLETTFPRIDFSEFGTTPKEGR